MIGAFIRSNSIHASAKARPLFVLLRFSLVLSMFLSSAAYAADGGKVMGTVKDQTGAVLPNAEVDLTSKSTGVAQNTKSDSAGAYTFPLVPVGTYTLTVHAAGFNPVEHEGLVVNIHSVVEQDLVLAVGDQM